MRLFRSLRGSLASLYLLVCSPYAYGSESIQELPTGGIDFLGSFDPATLVLDSEDMKVTPDVVTVTYHLTNQSEAPLDLSLRFVYPDLDFSDPDVSFAIPASDPINFLGAEFKIDGKPVTFVPTQRAVLNDKDITEKLRRTKLALVPIGTFQNEIADMPEDQRKELEAANLIQEAGTTVEGNPIFFPKWTVRTSAIYKATIPAKGSLVIGLRYNTSIGISRDTPLRKALRGQQNLLADVKTERSKYCIDDGFLNGLDLITGAAEANGAGLTERRIEIIPRHSGQQMAALKYHLVVDKLKPQRIISFCLDNLKKISLTAFELQTGNYLPKSRLDLLLIDRQ